MLRLERIGGENADEIAALAVSDEQKGFVADNAQSLAEAAVANRSGGHAFPFGVYDGGEAVGFVMVGFGTDDEWADPPEIAKDSYNIWRLMIDKRYQKRGYGKEAIKLALDFIRTWPCGKAEYCSLSYEPENEVARELYRSLGFTENGEMDGDEIVAVLKL